MRSSSFFLRAFALLSCIGFFLAPGGALRGQSSSRRDFDLGIRSGVGYVGAIPEAAAGVGAWHLFDGGQYGVFVDAKMTLPSVSSDGDYCPAGINPCAVPDIEVDRFDHVLRDLDEFLLFNAGGMMTLSPEVAVLLGAGLARHSRYREYFDGSVDTDLLVTGDGSYFAPYDPESEWTAQWVVGMLFRLSNRIVLRFGYERAPGGISFGGYWAFAR